MNEITRYRGPDDTGYYTDDHISLGHTRLSIIDLSSNGHQPMSNEDGSVWITFNGEIYNFNRLKSDLLKSGHIFKSNTDTEVILHLYEDYGLDCIKYFNGMWAFCIYDKNKEILILSRDPFGIKPLYYYIDDQKIIFSSMISSILCHSIETGPDDTAIMDFLAYNLEDQATRTFFKNINSLPRDSLLIYDLRTKKYQLKKWYAPEYNAPGNGLKDLLIESIRTRLISDVPVGGCLSGGLDSSSIICILDRYIHNNFYTFSYIAPGTPFDESRYIKEVGRCTKTTQFFTQITPEQFIDDCKDFILAQEEPVTGLSPYAQYMVMKLAHEHNVKVLLDGQGADELFAGYIYYFSYYFYELLITYKWATLIKEVTSYIKAKKNLYAPLMFAYILLPDVIKYGIWKHTINKWINHRLLERVCGPNFDPRLKRMDLNTALSLTLFSTAIPHLLRFEDKNSMRWSVESRPPFLDPSLVNYALSLPSDKKIKGGYGKITFKDAISDMLPDMIKNRTDKNGFDTPINDFFRDEKIIDFCKKIIYSESFRNRPYWKWSKIEEIFNNHLNNKGNSGEIIWKCINVELWLKIFFDDKSKAPERDING